MACDALLGKGCLASRGVATGASHGCICGGFITDGCGKGGRAQKQRGGGGCCNKGFHVSSLTHEGPLSLRYRNVLAEVSYPSCTDPARGANACQTSDRISPMRPKETLNHGVYPCQFTGIQGRLILPFGQYFAVVSNGGPKR